MKEPTTFNGGPRAQDNPGTSNGRPVKYRCRDCAWSGNGSIARAAHWRATGHTTLPGDDPRFKVTARKDVA